MRGSSPRMTIEFNRKTLKTMRRSMSALLSLDLVEFGRRSFKFVIEEPHRIENFAQGCRCFCPVGLSKGEDAVVAQKTHDPRVGNLEFGQVARFESGPGRTGNDLHQLEQLHLIDRIRQ